MGHYWKETVPDQLLSSYQNKFQMDQRFKNIHPYKVLKDNNCFYNFEVGKNAFSKHWPSSKYIIREKIIFDYLKMSNSSKQIKNCIKVKNERQTGNNICTIYNCEHFSSYKLFKKILVGKCAKDMTWMSDLKNIYICPKDTGFIFIKDV